MYFRPCNIKKIIITYIKKEEDIVTDNNILIAVSFSIVNVETYVAMGNKGNDVDTAA